MSVWKPAESVRRGAALERFAHAVGLPDATYDELHRWSVDDLEAFWTSAARFLGVRWHTEPTATLGTTSMPGAEWFPGGTLSFAEHLFQDRDPAAVAIRFASESRPPGQWTWAELERQAARIRSGLVALGVGPRDRVASYLPNLPETVAAFVATTSLGAVWTAVAPEFGEEAVVARFGQTKPRVLLAVDGYRHRGKTVHRDESSRAVADEVGARHVRFGLLDGTGWQAGFVPDDVGRLDFAAVDVEHPLWIVYSSGTTGPPKPIVHGHGGALLELLKTGVLQLGLDSADRVFWFTTTGWVMWNVMLAPLLSGSSVVLFDGHPDPDALWSLAASEGVTVFGTSAAWLDAARVSGAEPAETYDLSALQVIGSTGSPLPAQCYDWVYDHFPPHTWLVSLSGGTDVVSPLLGLAPTVPVHRGELGPPALGVDLQAWTEDGRDAGHEVGEMVVVQPVPSMPVGFWGDDGSAMRASYFDRFPGTWAHGDWLQLTARGTGIISGRSDATINRGGVRIGTAEIYDGLHGAASVIDALAIDLPQPNTHGLLMLLVVVATEDTDHTELRHQIATVLRERCSPRHVPDVVVLVPEIVRTISGKRVEVPLKRILMGADPARAVSRGSLVNPEALDVMVEQAHQALARSRIEG